MTTPAPSNTEFIKKLREITLANISDEHFGVNELAKATGLNYFSLNRKLHSVTRKTTSQFINEVRLEKAKEILEQEDHLTASEVAYRVGFSSPAYFSRCFHEHYGYPPGEIKKRGSTDHKETSNDSSLTSQPEEEAPNNFQEQKPSREKPGRKGVVLASAGMLILAILASFYFFRIFNQSLPGLNPKDKSIAVLPFKSLSSDTENQYFAEGVTRSILYNLIQISEIKVINSPVKELEGNPMDLKKMAGKLNVRFFLAGSVQKSGEQVLVMAQLTDITKNQIIWSDKYSRKLSDIFMIQSDIAKQVATNLQTVISRKENEQIEKMPTQNKEAYNLYLKGRYLLNLRREGDIKIIVDCFENAIAADPDYAEAYASMAETYWLYTTWRFSPRPEGFIKAKEFALKALQLDSNLAETHTVMGCLLSTEYKWEEARKEFELAVQLNPNSATARQYYSGFLTTVNQHQEARVQIDIAKDLNPVSPMVLYKSAGLYEDEEKYKEALDECDKIVELDPQFYSVYWRYFDIYLKIGDELKAVEVHQKAHSIFPEDVKYIPVIKEVYDKYGMTGIFKWQIEYDLKDTINGYMGVAFYYMRLGEKEKALDYLEMAYKTHLPHLPGNMYSNRFKSLRNEPRFQALLDSMNLTPYQTREVNRGSQNQVRK